MEARKWDKYFVHKTPPTPFHPEGSFEGEEMFIINDQVMPGAFRYMCAWFAGPWTEEDTPKPHMHNYDEIVMFIGSDPANPHKLGGELEFWFEDDKYLITDSVAIYVPKLTKHAPMRPTRVDDPTKPMLFVGTLPCTMKDDIMLYNREAKWSNYQDPPSEFPGVFWLDEVNLDELKAKYA